MRDLMDLNHSHVSHAAIDDESLPATNRVLGHRRASTIDSYNQLDDATLSQAAEREANSIARKGVCTQWGLMAV